MLVVFGDHYEGLFMIISSQCAITAALTIRTIGYLRTLSFLIILAKPTISFPTRIIDSTILTVKCLTKHASSSALIQRQHEIQELHNVRVRVKTDSFLVEHCWWISLFSRGVPIYECTQRRLSKREHRSPMFRFLQRITMRLLATKGQDPMYCVF